MSGSYWYRYKFYSLKSTAEKHATALRAKGYTVRVEEVPYIKGKDGKGYYTAVKRDGFHYNTKVKE